MYEVKSLKAKPFKDILKSFTFKLFKATKSKEALDLEKELDQELSTLKQSNNDEDLLQHEKYVDLLEKIAGQFN